MNCPHAGPFVKMEDRWWMCVCGETFRELTPIAHKRITDWQDRKIAETPAGPQLEYFKMMREVMG